VTTSPDGTPDAKAQLESELVSKYDDYIAAFIPDDVEACVGNYFICRRTILPKRST
jgi:hypothetical protein